MSRFSKRAVTLGLTVTFLTVVSCSSTNSASVGEFDNETSHETSSPELVPVERGDITPVITLPSQVVANARYKVTSDISGLVSFDGAVIVVSNDDRLVEYDPRAYGRDAAISVQAGDTISAGLPLFEVTYTGFVLSAQISGANLLRFQEQPEGFRGQISGAGSPFDCEPLNPFPSSDSSGSITVGCIIPSGQPAIEGLEGVLAIRMQGATNVLVLPVEAVAGTVGSGSVYLADSMGTPKSHPIELGVSDGSVIEVKSGLNEGDRVHIPGPSLPGV